MKKNSLAFQIWKYFILFALFLLFFLWLFQILLLDHYYEWNKIDDSKEIAKLLTQNNLTQADIEKVAFEKDVCIELTSVHRELYQIGNCLVDTNDAISKFLYNNEKEKSYVFQNRHFQKKFLVYGKKLGEDTYLFVSTSLSPLNATAGILSQQLFYVTIFVFFLSFLVAYFLSRHLSKPIVTISKASKQIAGGAFQTKFQTEEDILELNELVTSLNEMKEELGKTEELRRDLMANVSHDLKTPLTLIKAYAEMVRDLHYKDKEKREQSLNTIIQEVDRLTVLVNDILELSKEEANVDSLELTEIPLNQLIEDVLSRYAILSQQEQYHFVFTHEEEVIIQADKKKLEQVIYNLINNAIQYTGEDKTITIVVSNQKEKVRIEIKDTGKGISKEDIPHIWDKYYKTKKNHQRNHYGTGLGLSIVKNILEHHHFTYGVTSKKGKGSCFYFEIPKERKQDTNQV